MFSKGYFLKVTGVIWYKVKMLQGIRKMKRNEGENGEK